MSKYRLVVDELDDKGEPEAVCFTEFRGNDVTVLQAITLFLNHVAQKKEQGRMYDVDPELERDINRAQLFKQYGTIKQPEGTIDNPFDHSRDPYVSMGIDPAVSEPAATDPGGPDKEKHGED